MTMSPVARESASSGATRSDEPTPAGPNRSGPLPRGPKLNLGCGGVQPAGWVNIDGSNRAKLANRFSVLDTLLVRLGVLPETEFGPHIMVHDLFKPLPFADNSVSCIYAGELWEHFEYDDAERLTRESLRVLAPGGVLRVCVPDGPQFWERYLDVYRSEMSRPREERSAQQLHRLVDHYFDDIATRRMWFKSFGHTHKWQYDEVQLVELFEDSGFVSVDRMPFHSSRIGDVNLVERSDFLIVEGVKP